MGLNLSRRQTRDYLQGLKMDELIKIIDKKEKITYVELCNRIKIERVSGDCKKKQIESLSFICQFNKNGRFFNFLRVKTEEEIKESILANSKLTYSELIEEGLINYMIKNKYKKVFLMTSQIFQIVGMVNENYNFIKREIKNNQKRKQIIETYNEHFNNFELVYFINHLYPNIFQNIILNSIKEINKHNRLIIHKGYIGIKTNNESGEKIYPNSKEGEIFKNILEDCLREVGVKNISSVFINNHTTNEYYQTKKRLCKERTQYRDFYDCYIITLGADVQTRYDANFISHKMNEKIKRKIMNNKDFERKIPLAAIKNLTNILISLNTKYNVQEDCLRHKEE